MNEIKKKNLLEKGKLFQLFRKIKTIRKKKHILILFIFQFIKLMIPYNETFSNYTPVSLCEIPQTVETYYDFFQCYKYFVQIHLTRSLIEILLSIGTSLANALVILCLILKPKKTIFDQIIFGHSNYLFKLKRLYSKIKI